MDDTASRRLQLPTGKNKLLEREQGPRLLLSRPVVPKRDATAPGDVTVAGVTGSGQSANDDDGGAEGTRQELRWIVQKHRATLHLFRGQDQIVGGRQKRGQRVGGLSRRER